MSARSSSRWQPRERVISPLDARGCPVSAATQGALDHYERALGAFLSWNGEPRAAAREATAETPAFVMGHVLEAQLHLCSRAAEDRDVARRAWQRAQALPTNERERLHLDAIGTALGGDYGQARRLLAVILARYPRDLLALAVSHTVNYYLGDTRDLYARVSAVLPAWSLADPGYHGVLAMLAFALEEHGDYDRAEAAAFGALALEPRSLRAHHARCHVLEMQGRADEGLRWMEQRAAHWDGAGASATHVWWHLALYHLELGRTRRALEIYDRRLGAAAAPSISELIDASALLWRLELRGVGPGARWRHLAERWAPHAEDGSCAFNDVHAMLAFVGSGRRDLAARLADTQRRGLAGGGTYEAMLRDVGSPACRALAAFGEDDYALAAALLRGLPERSHRIGGSHAQRGLIGLTLRAAEARLASVRRTLFGGVLQPAPA